MLKRVLKMKGSGLTLLGKIGNAILVLEWNRMLEWLSVVVLKKTIVFNMK